MTNHDQSSEAKTKQFLGTLPFRSRQRDYPDFHYDVSVWRCSHNVCELSGRSPCDTLTETYYGSAEDEVTKFCPRHFYEMQYAPDECYQLVDGETEKYVVQDTPQSPASISMETEQLKSLAEQALDAFWETVVKQYPQARPGDLSPLATIQLELAAEAAIKEWVDNNVPKTRNGKAA